MCEICKQLPCHPRCPNASEPKPIVICEECGYEIFEGEVYYKFDGQNLCEECFVDFARLKYRRKAESETPDYDDYYGEDD